jgi:hypothetical protein
MRLAVMQPYFAPYLGYLSLFSVCDHVVLLDNVQFPRRGWVHRNRLRTRNGHPNWCTLPLQKGPQHLRIQDLQFTKDAGESWKQRLSSFPAITQSHPLYDALLLTDNNVRDYLKNLLIQALQWLALPVSCSWASSLSLPDTLKGPEKIVSICKMLGAKTYINLPGGRSLYDKALFLEHNMELLFLGDFQGDSLSLLQRFADDSKQVIKNDILCHSKTLSAA